MGDRRVGREVWGDFQGEGRVVQGVVQEVVQGGGRGDDWLLIRRATRECVQGSDPDYDRIRARGKLLVARLPERALHSAQRLEAEGLSPVLLFSGKTVDTRLACARVVAPPSCP